MNAAQRRSWHDHEESAYQLIPFDDVVEARKPARGIAYALAASIMFIAIISALVFAIGAIAHDSTGKVRREVSNAQPGTIFGIDRMSDLFWWLR